MLTSSRRSLHAARQDDAHTADTADADDVFDADSYDLPTPTFFPQAFREIPVSRLADRYRSARDISPVPEVTSRRPGQSRALAHYPVRAARYSRDLEDAFQPSEELWRRPGVTALPEESQSRAPRRSQAALFVAAGLAAIVAGGGLGYLTTRLTNATGQTGIAAAAQPVIPANATTVAATSASAAAVSRKPITMAKLEVADASGDLNSMIPLALHAEDPGLGQNIILKLSGLPKSAYLTAGTRTNDSDWQLAAADAAGVKLVVPRADAQSFKVGVTALATKTGEMVAPTKEITIAITGPQAAVVPASAPPETAIKVSAPGANTEGATPIPKPAQQLAAVDPASEAQNLISKGDIVLKSGDLAMARQFYERAYADGAKAAAALGVGKTFDPVVYEQLKVQGLQPDPQQALDWYERAKAAGNPDAAAAIDALKQTAP